jgi:hypothetical protein
MPWQASIRAALPSVRGPVEAENPPREDDDRGPGDGQVECPLVPFYQRTVAAALYGAAGFSPAPAADDVRRR